MNWNWTDFYPEWTDPFQIRSSFLEKDLDPIKIQEKWSEFRIWNCCVQILTMYARDFKYRAWHRVFVRPAWPEDTFWSVPFGVSF